MRRGAVEGHAAAFGHALEAVEESALLFGAPAGVLVDRFDRRLVLWISNLLRAIACVIFAAVLMVDAAPLLPFYVYTRSELTKPYLRGSVINFENRHMFKYWWIDQRWYSGVQDNLLDHGFPARPQSSVGSAGGGAP